MLPAGGEKGGTKDLLSIGSEGAGAVVVLVVALALPQIDEAVLDATLHQAGHVVVD